MERMTSSAHGFPYNSIPQRGSQTEAFPGSVVVTDEIDHLNVQLGLSLGGGGRGGGGGHAGTRLSILWLYPK